MIYKYFFRNLCSSKSLYNAEKSALANLRKKTGYTFANCKKALEIHNNDVGKAEAWLKEQARSLGWSKATKLQGRQTTQGLIGVLVQNNVASMVEVGCETDFVARNEHFQNMIGLTAHACNQLGVMTKTDSPFLKNNLDKTYLSSLKAVDGIKLADHLALMIGKVGENATMKRAIFIKSDETTLLFGYAHPAGLENTETLLGRVAGIVALKQMGRKIPDDFGKKICQHIVGMAPKRIGTLEDIPDKNSEEEVCLIHQEYLHDNDFTVKEVLEEHEVEIVDFIRYECGEEINDKSQPLEELRICE